MLNIYVDKLGTLKNVLIQIHANLFKKQFLPILYMLNIICLQLSEINRLLLMSNPVNQSEIYC